jgi:hypothetical protein
MSRYVNYRGVQYNAETQFIGYTPEQVEAMISTATRPLQDQVNAAGITTGRVIELARIAGDVPDLDAVLAELRRAVEVAVEVQQRGHAGSNAGDFV